MYAAAQKVDFDPPLWDASKAVFQDTSGSDRETLFFLSAYGKAQILMANCKNWKAEAPQALVCWVCRCNRAQCLANFGLEDTIEGWWDVVLPIGAIYRHIAADCRIPDYGCTGCCVSLYVVSRACATQWRQERASPRLLLCAVCFSPFYMLAAFKRRR